MRSRTKLLACLMGVALAVPAIAQSSGTLTQYPACPDPPPKLTRTELEAAHLAFQVGTEAYQASDYQKALDNFKESFRRDCSKIALLDFIARAYEGKGDRAEAIHALETYLQRNPHTPDAETIQTRIQNLRALMQQQQPTVSLTAQPTATATVTTEPTTTATVAPTATTTSPPPEERGHTPWPWVVVGVGVAAAVAGGILIGVGEGYISEAHDGCVGGFSTQACGGNTPPPKYGEAGGVTRQDVENRGSGLANAGLIVGGVGVAALIGGLIWHFAEPTGPVKTGSLEPLLGFGTVGLRLRY